MNAFTTYQTIMTDTIYEHLISGRVEEAKETVLKVVELARLWKGEDTEVFADAHKLSFQDSDLVVLTAQNIQGGGNDG